MIVYKITNKINGKVYVGQTRYSLAHRWSQHCRLKSRCSALSSAIQKYGKESFTKEILGAYAEDDLTNAEVYFINYHNCISPNGYNLTEGGEAARISEETKKKMSESQKGSKGYWFGKKQSEETRERRSAALKGRKRPLEVVEKIKASHNPISDKNLTYRRPKAV